MGRYKEILKGLNEAIDYVDGNKNGTAVHKRTIKEIKEYSPGQIKEIRNNTRMTQNEFAACIGVTKKAVEAWEGGRSRPDGAARRTIGLLEENPFFAENAGIICCADPTFRRPI